MRIRLERVTNGAALRTTAVEGVAKRLPRTGRRFTMLSEDVLTPGASVRLVETSEVRAVRARQDQSIEFDTENSTYRLTLLGAVN